MFPYDNNYSNQQRVQHMFCHRSNVGRLSPSESLDWNDMSMGKRSSAQMDDLYGDTDTEDSFDSMHRRSNVGELSKLSCSSDEYISDVHGSHHPPQQFKCRQLPCRTFISTGSCPYGDRCVFLHDACIVAKPVYIKTKRKSKDDTATDNFFWPTMSLNSVMTKVDNKNMPHIAQPYFVPAPNSYSHISCNNDRAVFSMWEHFLDFCKADAMSIVTVPRNVPPLNKYVLNNPYSGRKRLPVFAKLSQNKSL